MLYIIYAVHATSLYIYPLQYKKVLHSRLHVILGVIVKVVHESGYSKRLAQSAVLLDARLAADVS